MVYPFGVWMGLLMVTQSRFCWRMTVSVKGVWNWVNIGDSNVLLIWKKRKEGFMWEFQMLY